MYQEHISHDNMDLEKISSSIICHNRNDNGSYEGWETMVMVSDEEEDHTAELRKGLWTPEEDSKLTSAIAIYGEGRWSSLAILAGLRRSGKSCRLRWLNYLRPDLRHGTFTLDEQLRILELHLRWGNRWSKIAQHLPGRTDNEVKNYWRTKVQKLARQFQCHVSSPEFRDALRHVWIPRLVEQIQAGADKLTSDNTNGAQTKGTFCDYECGFGLVDSEYITGPRNCCLFDTHTYLDESSMAHNIIGVGDETLGANATSFPDFCEAQISQKSSPSTQLDQNLEQNINDNFWEMILTYGDNLLLMKQQIEHFA